MTKTTIELLREAREWLSVEEHWCAHKRHGLNNTTCALGALELAGGADAWEAYFHGRYFKSQPLAKGQMIANAVDRLARAVYDLGGQRPGSTTLALCVANFNDRQGWSRTLDMFDLAIKLEQEEMDRQAKELVESCVGEAVAQ